jgi:hypothetical protein
MKGLLSQLALCLLIAAAASAKVRITEGEYEGAGHFIIRTKTAIYYLDKQGGGLSRMIDRRGNDWIAFRREPWDRYPESAASAFRGLPNLVFGSDDSGAGHPGHDKCYSFKANRNTIITISRSGRWQWRWNFYDKYATLTVEKTDPEHKYWFLYEGPAGGRFKPQASYWGTNMGGPRTEIYDYYRGDEVFANWWWVYFGDYLVKRILFLGMQQPDRYLDVISYLGNSPGGLQSEDGMVVFGFGRIDNAIPQLIERNNKFYFGFIKARVKNPDIHDSVAKDIESLLKN